MARKTVLNRGKDSNLTQSSSLTIKNSCHQVINSNNNIVGSQPEKMAGEIRFQPNVQSSSGARNTSNVSNGNKPVILKQPRKTWSLQDRSVLNVNILKANLAEEGCEEAQLDVAKKLLHDAQFSQESNQCEKSRLAVYWLIKSSEQGNEEATILLEECLKSGKGITCQNIIDVKTCLDTPRNDKNAFKAARIIYSKFNNGEEFVTTTQLHSRLLSLKAKAKASTNKSKNTNSAHPEENDSSSDNESIENGDLNTTFILEPTNKRRRYGPAQDIDDDSGRSRSPDTNYLLSRRKELNGIKMTLDDLLKTASTCNAGEIPKVAIDPAQNISLRQNWSLVSIWTAFVVQFLLLTFIPDVMSLSTCLQIGSIYLLTWSCHNLRLWRKRRNNFEDWIDLFKSALNDGPIREFTGEKKLSRNWLNPFLGGSSISLIIFTLCPDTFLKATFGPIMIISIICARIGGRFLPSYRILGLMALTVLRNCPFVSNNISLLVSSFQKLPLPIPLEHTIPEVISEYATLEIFLTILQGLVLLSLVLKGRDIVPECLLFFWFSITIKCAIAISTDQLVLAGTMIIAFELMYYFITCNKKFTLLTTTVLTTVILLISLGLFLLIDYQLKSATNVKYLEWEEYESNCHTKAWKSKSQSVAETQVFCTLKYENAPVKWKGIVSLVKLQELKGKNQDGFRNALFEVLINVVDDEDGISAKSGDSWDWLRFGKNNKDFTAPATLWIYAKENEELKYILSLRPGDQIEFTGILSGNIGNMRPEISRVRNMKCVSCAVAHYNLVEFKEFEINIFQSQYLNNLLGDVWSFFKILIKRIEGFLNSLYLCSSKLISM